MVGQQIKQNIPLFKVFMSPEALSAATDVLGCGYITQGPKVGEFEKNLSNTIQNDKVLTLNSATSGLHLALHLLGLNSGDEVLTSPLTCTATNWPILANGLKIKWVDIDSHNLNLNLDDLENKLTPKTKAIMAVHWGGYPNDLNRLAKIQDKCKEMYGFKPSIIEDCAHAFGSTFENKPLGNHGNLCVYSLQAIKHITSVDGGVIVLPNKELYDRAKLSRWYGIDRENNKKDFRCEEDIPAWGFKFHMNDVNAAIGNENLKYSEYIISKHQDNADYYDKELENVHGVTLLERAPNRRSAFWIYSMLVDDRTGFMNHMKEKNIVVSQVHERNDIHSCVKGFQDHLPILDKTIKNVVSIPVGWWVSNEDREYIIEAIKEGW